jgi:hypothetical protein
VSLLARLERRFSWFAVPDLSYLLVGLAGLVWILGVVKPLFPAYLLLDPAAVRAGELWRLFTFQFVIEAEPLWFFFTLYWMYMVYRNLEEQWGYFRFTLYWFIGFSAMAAATMVTHGGASPELLSTSFFLAFATLNPNFEFRLFMIVPMKVKYLGFVTAAYLLYKLLAGPVALRLQVGAATLNYLIFFAAHWRDFFAGERRLMQARRRRVGLRSAEPLVGRGERKCAICGAKQSQGADIRVCSCEKCGGERCDLCITHAREH